MEMTSAHLYTDGSKKRKILSLTEFLDDTDDPDVELALQKAYQFSLDHLTPKVGGTELLCMILLNLNKTW